MMNTESLTLRDQAFIKKASQIHYNATVNNVLAIAVLFFHGKRSTMDEPIHSIVLSPPTHDIGPDFVKDVFLHLFIYPNTIVPKVEDKDFYAYLFFTHVKSNPRFSYFWITYAQFEPQHDTPFKSCQKIMHGSEHWNIEFSTRYYSSLCTYVNEEKLLEYSKIFIERWKVYGALILFNPLKSKPILHDYHKPI